MLEGTGPELVKQMKKKNMEKEDHNLENDAEMEDVEEKIVKMGILTMIRIMITLKTLAKTTRW